MDREAGRAGGLAGGRRTDLAPYLDRVDYPYYVVTVRSPDGVMSGCLAGFVCQCSIDPPQHLVCISKANHTFGVAEQSTSMAIHLLGSDQSDMARLFGENTGDLVDKFAHCDWHVGSTGAPLLAETAAALEGEIAAHFSAGDHEAFLLRAVSATAGSHGGLLMYRSGPDMTPGHPA